MPRPAWQMCPPGTRAVAMPQSQNTGSRTLEGAEETPCRRPAPAAQFSPPARAVAAKGDREEEEQHEDHTLSEAA